MIMFAVIRAVVVGGTVALAFGLKPAARLVDTGRGHGRDEAEP